MPLWRFWKTFWLPLRSRFASTASTITLKPLYLTFHPLLIIFTHIHAQYHIRNFYVQTKLTTMCTSPSQWWRTSNSTIALTPISSAQELFIPHVLCSFDNEGPLRIPSLLTYCWYIYYWITSKDFSNWDFLPKLHRSPHFYRHRNQTCLKQAGPWFKNKFEFALRFSADSCGGFALSSFGIRYEVKEVVAAITAEIITLDYFFYYFVKFYGTLFKICGSWLLHGPWQWHHAVQSDMKAGVILFHWGARSIVALCNDWSWQKSSICI